ncbi:MAG TPA: asparaginase [Polyangia bacterium]|nr:asparaginase [Polyangia bacterium]
MKRVLILHTGGTLGMSGRRPAPLQPDTYTQEILTRVPELGELAEVETRILCNLDSSDLGPDEWAALTDEIAGARATHDGIVIIHGTDTMAYTASALSFALGGLDRPVVLTGSQRPLGEIRTDARRNLVDAVDLATRALPEVGIAFDGRLYRGNRATKGDAWSYAAFASPGCPPLARLGLDVEIGATLRTPREPFAADGRFDARVAVCHVLPGMEPGLLARLVGDSRADDSIRGVVLAAFGVGNVPARTRAVAAEVRRLVDAGVTVLVVTQARAGAVDLGLYANGAGLAEAGAISGGDLGLEAAVTKLMHALALWPGDAAERRAYLLRDVAGERLPG